MKREQLLQLDNILITPQNALILVGKVGSKNKEDAPYELESQFVLRLPSVRLVHDETDFIILY